MAINEYEFANGVVLNGLIKSGISIKIAEFPTSSEHRSEALGYPQVPFCMGERIQNGY